MSYEEYIDKRIENKEESNRSFKTLSIILLTIGILLIIFPFLNLIEMQTSMQFAGHGFGAITLVVPYYLQGKISRIKEDIINLQFLKSNLEKIEDHIIEQALKSI